MTLLAGAGDPARAAAMPLQEDALHPCEELFERLVHDLRNPLGNLAFFAEALGEASAEERRDFCDRLQVNAARALQVLEELALLADLRAGRCVPSPTRCPLGELFERVAGAVHAAHPGLLRWRSADAWAPVAPAHLACALRPLLRHALQVVDAAGSIELSAALRPGEVVIGLAVPRPARASARAAVPDALACELAGRIARLYGGVCEVRETHDGARILMTIPLGAPPTAG